MTFIHLDTGAATEITGRVTQPVTGAATAGPGARAGSAMKLGDQSTLHRGKVACWQSAAKETRGGERKEKTWAGVGSADDVRGTAARWRTRVTR
eukprot:757750-Hanusia_phi.AAC.1